PRPYAVGQEAEPGEVLHHRAVHVLLEVLAERRIVVGRRRLAAIALDLVDLPRAEADVLVGLEREEARQGLLEREAGVILELAPLGRRCLVHDLRQREHAEAHVARLVLQDAPADRAEHWIARALSHHLEEGDREGLGHQLQRDRLEVPAALREDRVEDVLLVGRHWVGQALEAVGKVAAQHFVVARLVLHLSGLEELLVGTLHDVHHLAARQERALLAVHQDREPPRGDATVQRDAVGLREALPDGAAVDVDQLVRDHAAVGGKRVGPGDVLRGVPLVWLRVLVEPPHVGFGDAVLERERRRERGGDREGFHWRRIAECYRGRHDRSPRRARRPHVDRRRALPGARARPRGRM